MEQKNGISLTLTALLPVMAVPVTAGQVSNKQAPERPNVLFIYADDVGYGDLACYGGLEPTPHVDLLASQGVLFTNAHATASTSTPSRFSLLTGCYPWRRPGTDVAAGNAGMIIRPDDYTLADVFCHSGYATGAFGKWHLGLGDKTGQQNWNAPLTMGVSDIGFQYSYLMAATADRVPCVFLENGKVQNLDPSDPIEVSYARNFEGEPTGKNNPELLFNLKPSHGHDMSIVNGISRIGYMKGGASARWKDENIADSIVAHALAFMERHREEPFFMYVCTNDIHVPRFPHSRFRGKSSMGLRGDAIAQFDWTVGQLMEKLKELHLEENTLVILTSDNGPVLDDGYRDEAHERVGKHRPSGPFRGGKYSSFEAGTAVPFIVRWPSKVAAGQVSSCLLSQIDACATMAALTETPLPVNAAADSWNQLDVWLNAPGVANDRSWVAEYAANHLISVRDKEWKYIPPCKGPRMVAFGPVIETGNDTVPQLYRFQEGLFEQTNRVLDYPEKRTYFEKILQSIR